MTAPAPDISLTHAPLNFEQDPIAFYNVLTDDKRFDMEDAKRVELYVNECLRNGEAEDCAPILDQEDQQLTYHVLNESRILCVFDEDAVSYVKKAIEGMEVEPDLPTKLFSAAYNALVGQSVASDDTEAGDLE